MPANRTHLLICALVLTQLGGLPATAGTPVADGETVVVKGIHAPELKPYRVMAAGLDAFDTFHALAPAAPEVRFKLRRASGSTDVDMDDLKLRIAGDTISIPLPLAADHTFALPRSSEATAEDADLVLNKKKGGYRWQVVVDSAGVPAGMRRLGDLRLECQVGVAIAKRELNFMQRAFVATILGTSDWCSSGKLNWDVRSTRPIASATLATGQRTVNFDISDDKLGYVAQTSDKSLPDDALIDIQFADDLAARPSLLSAQENKTQ